MHNETPPELEDDIDNKNSDPNAVEFKKVSIAHQSSSNISSSSNKDLPPIKSLKRLLTLNMKESESDGVKVNQWIPPTKPSERLGRVGTIEEVKDEESNRGSESAKKDNPNIQKLADMSIPLISGRIY